VRGRYYFKLNIKIETEIRAKAAITTDDQFYTLIPYIPNWTAS
jgi:hypothetical protein